MVKIVPTSLVLALLALTCVCPIGIPSARAQDTPPKKEKDEALDRLLEKLDGAKPADKKEEVKSKKKEEAKVEKKASGEAAPKSDSGPTAKKPAEVSPKDKALDNLLEKLGETEDKPSPDDRRPAPGGSNLPDTDKEKDKDQQKGKGDKPAPKSLTGKDKSTDEHLEELTGKIKKKKGDDEANSSMQQVIKEMREVEERLGKPDTGEETRKKQQEIVKNLDTMIEKMRQSSAQQKMQKKQKQIAGMNPGQQPGQQNDEAGNTGGNAPHQKPEKPQTGGRHPVGGKDTWGHLPPELRQEMENVFTEDFLPRKKEKINRYYLDLTKKTVTRNRGE